MKRIDLLFTTLLVPFDFAAVLLAGIVAYNMRFLPSLTAVRPVIFDLPFERFFEMLLPLPLVFLAVFALSGLYAVRPPNMAREVLRIVLASFSALGTVLAIAFFFRETFDSRFIFLAGGALAIAFLVAERLILRLSQRLLRYADFGVRRLAIVGKTNSGNDLMRFFADRPTVGFKPVYQAASWNEATENKLRAMARNGELHALMLANALATKDEINAMKFFAETEHVEFAYAAALDPSGSLQPIVHNYGGYPVIEVPRTPLDGWGAIYKRGFDIVVGGTAFLLTLPIVILFWILLVIEDGRPAFFINERIGTHGREFKLYKLRSMWRKYCIGPQFAATNSENLDLEAKLIDKNSERKGPVYKIKDDPRPTRIGRFIRATSIDELPQFWNVVKGDMSLIGPRPHQPREVQKYKAADRRVFTIKPGITGLAQVSGRASLDFQDEVALDMHYIETWSPWKDLVILLKTPLVVLLRRGAL